MFITSLLVVVGVGFAHAQIRPPSPCPPPPRDPTTVFRNATEPDIKRGIPSRIRKSSSCYKAIQEGAAASLINPADWIDKPSRWLSVCIGTPRNITLNTWTILKGRICYVPKPITDYSYPTVDCPFSSCRGVRPTANREFAFCRPQNYKKYTICVWCLNKKGDKFVKEECDIHTYRCCSCCRYRC